MATIPCDVSKLQVAENALETFIAGKMSTQQLEETLGKALTAANFNNKGKKFQVIIPKKPSSVYGDNTFFGMCVFPAVNYLQSLAEQAASFAPIKTMKELWTEIDEFVIELDPRILDKRLISLNHKELLACILHEIGHSVFSDKAVSRFMRSMQGVVAKTRAADKAAIKAGYILFMIPMSVAVMGVSLWRSMNGGGGVLGDEYYADNFAVKCGYGEYLLSALDKILLAFGARDSKTTEVEVNKQIDAEMRWSVTITNDVTARRNNLAKNLMTKAMATPSNYVKALIGDVMQNTGVQIYDRYEGGVTESYIGALLNPACESIYGVNTLSKQFSEWDAHIEAARTQSRFIPGTKAFESILRQKVKQGLPSQAAVDDICIALDKIRTQADRDLVLDRIYDLIDEINEYMEYAESNQELYSRVKPQADRLLQQLDEYRERALAKKVRPGGSTAEGGTGKSGRTPSIQTMMKTGDYSKMRV